MRLRVGQGRQGSCAVSVRACRVCGRRGGGAPPRAPAGESFAPQFSPHTHTDERERRYSIALVLGPRWKKTSRSESVISDPYEPPAQRACWSICWRPRASGSTYQRARTARQCCRLRICAMVDRPWHNSLRQKRQRRHGSQTTLPHGKLLHQQCMQFSLPPAMVRRWRRTIRGSREAHQSSPSKQQMR